MEGKAGTADDEASVVPPASRGPAEAEVVSMRALSGCALLAVSLTLVQGPALRAGGPGETPPPPCGCSHPAVVEAQPPKVIVEVPPPNVIIRAAEPAPCGGPEGFFNRCCRSGCR